MAAVLAEACAERWHLVVAVTDCTKAARIGGKCWRHGPKTPCLFDVDLPFHYHHRGVITDWRLLVVLLLGQLGVLVLRGLFVLVVSAVAQVGQLWCHHVSR